MGDDFRILLVSLSALERSLGPECGLGRFGEVASISATGGSAVVEYYDIRSAMALAAAAGGGALPCTPQRLAQQAALLAKKAHAETPQAAPKSPTVAPPPGLEDLRARGPLRHASDPPQRLPPAATEPRHATSQSNPPAMSKSQSMVSAASEEAKGVNRPVRTKVSSRDFSKFDLDPDKISTGQDQRTTVMVRNLVGPRARKDFLRLLEKCGLADRYTFFYMPCKEHRDVPAGFAFVNLNSPADVLQLHCVVKKDMWRTQIRDMQAKPLGLSYARFQGHEELMAHFSSSVVLCEQDPDKRPLFCNPNRKATDSPMSQASTAPYSRSTSDGSGCDWACDRKERSDSEVSASAPWVGA
mmetsp:Transcript_48006/g.126758  ORF Transcript_48006/g.126758 Transcript_48006/m.126758 type:complete len:356 (-) Transcript_48006:101-1168(-)